MKKRLGIIVWALLAIMHLSCEPEDRLIVGIASSLIQPMEEVVGAYEKEYGYPVSIVSAASGLITSQIQKGAPYDLFISAHQKHAEYLMNSGYAEATIPWLNGKLICWCRDHENMKDCLSHSGKIALPNPDLAPYGLAAKTWLDREGLWTSLEDRFVFGESVGQTNAYIHSEAVGMAFTSFSSRYLLDKKGHWISLGGRLQPESASDNHHPKRQKGSIIGFCTFPAKSIFTGSFSRIRVSITLA